MHLGLRRPPQKLGHGAGVVRLKMVQDQCGDLVIAGHLLEVGQEIFGELGLDGINHRDPIAAANRIGIVGGAVGGFQDHIEMAQAGVQCADPGHALGHGHRPRRALRRNAGDLGLGP